MGFFEGLGKFAGGMVGQMEQLSNQVNMYREEYEGMSNSELKEEGRRWQNRGGSEARARVGAIKLILKDRGVI